MLNMTIVHRNKKQTYHMCIGTERERLLCMAKIHELNNAIALAFK